jgi:hypothetical protein
MGRKKMRKAHAFRSAYFFFCCVCFKRSGKAGNFMQTVRRKDLTFDPAARGGGKTAGYT